MALARVQMSWDRDNGQPEDVVTNTWYFWDDSAVTTVDASDANSLSDALNTFYNSLSARYAGYLGVIRTIRVYDMLDAEPRVPVHEEAYTPTAPTNNGLPGECSACLSFYGAVVSGTNPRRRRGRVYLGPLCVDALDTSGSSSDAKLSSATLTAIDSAYVALATAAAAISPSYLHCVYSPTEHAESLSMYAGVTTVANCYVDDNVDIQRKRGSVVATRRIIVP